MKTFKAICAATALALFLTISAYADAGDGHGTGKNTAQPRTYVTTNEAPEDSVTTSAADSDLDLLTFENIMWALTSIY